MSLGVDSSTGVSIYACRVIHVRGGECRCPVRVTRWPCVGVREGRMEHISIHHLGLKLPAPTWKPSAGLLQEGLLYCNADPPLT